MIFAFLSARVRRWFFFAFVLPLLGRVLEAVGGRVAGRNPAAGRALQSTAGYLRGPRTDPALVGKRRRRGKRW